MPQHAKRIKVRRKDLRKPDEFETLTGQALDWADDHRALGHRSMPIGSLEGRRDEHDALDGGVCRVGREPGDHQNDPDDLRLDAA